MLFHKKDSPKPQKQEVHSVKEDLKYLTDLQVAKGASKRAAKLVMDSFLSGKIDAETTLKKTEELQYCVNLVELVARYRVSEAPKEKAKRTPADDIIYGAMFGDAVGSIYEGTSLTDASEAIRDPLKKGCFLTDDSILTLATWRVLQKRNKVEVERRDITLNDIGQKKAFPILYNPYATEYRKAAKQAPSAGYGTSFFQWVLFGGNDPYGSLGNGSAMRISPVGAICEAQDNVILNAAFSAMSTHNHVEGVKGAIVTAMCIWMARVGYSKQQIFNYMKHHYSYGEQVFKEFTYEEGTRRRINQVQCSYSVPASVISFNKSTNYREAINLSACIGYDNDTNACICGGIAAAYYGIDDDIRRAVIKMLDQMHENGRIEGGYLMPGTDKEQNNK